jgi:hypothetical protein
LGPPLVAHLGEARWGGGDAEAAVAEAADRSGQVGGVKILGDQRVVGDEHAVLERQVHRGGSLTAPGRCEQDDVGLVQGLRALPVVVLHGVLDCRHPGVVPLDVADTM